MITKTKLIKYTKTTLQILITAALFAFLLETFGGKGIFGYILVVFLFGIWRLYHYRENLMELMRQTESVLFGKPLDKEYWENDRPKLKKMRIKK